MFEKEAYQVRWGIEVLIKDCRRNLGFGKCQSNDFDAQVADITITLMTYIVAALDLRFSEYETMGQLFDSMAGELTKLTQWSTILFFLKIARNPTFLFYFYCYFSQSQYSEQPFSMRRLKLKR